MFAKLMQILIAIVFSLCAIAIVVLFIFVADFVWRMNHPGPTEPKDPLLVVDLNRDGQMVLNGGGRLETVPKIQRYMLDQYAFFKRDRGQQAVKDMIVVVHADSAAENKHVIQMVNAAREAGFVNIYVRESGLPETAAAAEARAWPLKNLIAIFSLFVLAMIAFGVIAILVILLFVARFLTKKKTAPVDSGVQLHPT